MIGGFTAAEKAAAIQGNRAAFTDPERYRLARKWVKDKKVVPRECEVCGRMFYAPGREMTARGRSICGYCFRTYMSDCNEFYGQSCE